MLFCFILTKILFFFFSKADSIFNDLINNIIKQHTLTSLTNIKDHSSLLNSSNSNTNSNTNGTIAVMVAMGLQVMKIMKLKIQQFKINQN